MTGTGTRSRTTPVRRQSHRTGSAGGGAARSRARRRRQGIGWKVRLVVASTLIILGLVAWAEVARYVAPLSNTSLTHFDAIIVLGVPADDDGNPTPLQLSRVTEAVHEYERGVAPRLILSGGATHHQFVEAEIMARTAEAQGIPESAIFVEGQARDTIQNACYSLRIMQSHGWHSAEVVSSAAHLPRAGLIFDRLPLEWRVHAAPPLERASGSSMGVLANALETLKTIRYLVWTRQMERCEP